MANYQAIIQDTRRRIEEDDREITQLQAAKERYDQDNDIQACIQEYEKVLVKGTFMLKLTEIMKRGHILIAC